MIFSRLFTAILTIVPVAIYGSPVDKRAPLVQIHPGGDQSRCLGVPGSGSVNQPLQVISCSSSGASVSWDIAPGDNTGGVKLGSLCLDAGANPTNNGPTKLYTCIAGAPQQRWFLTDDSRIAITGGSQCLDIGPNGPQTYQCTPGNTNQVFTTGSGGGDGGGGGGGGGHGTVGRQFHPNGDNSKCLTVQNGVLADGARVAISDCFQGSTRYSQLQSWIINRGVGALQVAGSNYCLDAGTNPANGVMAKIWTCYPGVSQQTYFYTDAPVNHIAINNGPGICLDVRAESGPNNGQPYQSTKDVQFWQCYGGSANQIWTL